MESRFDTKEWWDEHWIKDNVVRRGDLPAYGK